jgi:RNA polymerase sigma factor (sigma-70 family)
VLLDELFEEYKTKKAGAGDDPKKLAEADDLLNKVAEEARDFSMRAVYWSKKNSFFRRLPQDEALSVFGETFMECLKRGLEGKTKTLSGCLCYYFPHRLNDHIRKEKDIPRPLSELATGTEVDADDLIDVFHAGDVAMTPDVALGEKEAKNRFLDSFGSLSRFQRDALILNFNNYSHAKIGSLLGSEKRKVTKEKFKARKKIREDLFRGE